MNEGPGRIFVKLLWQAVVIVMLLSLPMGWISKWYAGRAGLSGLAAAAIICLAAAMISLIPIAMAGNRHQKEGQADRLAMACLIGTGIRLLLTMSAGLVVYLVLRPPMMVFSLSLVVFYLALLAWETLTAMKMIRKQYNFNT